VNEHRGGNRGSGHSNAGRGNAGRGGNDHRRNDRGHERSGSRGHGGPRQGWSQDRPSERSRAATPTRIVAFEALQAVHEEDAYANLVLPRLLRKHRLHGRDAGFTTELVYGTLRAQGRLDAVIARCVDRDLEEVEVAVLDVLRLGAHQLLDMEVAPHAATSETVALTRARVGAGAAGLVNAVMRRIGEHSAEEWLEIVAPADPDASADAQLERLAILHSHPLWMVRALRDALAGHGRDRSEIEALLESQNRAPSVSLVMRPGLTDSEELAAAGAGPAHLSLFGASWPGGDPGGVDAVRVGRAAVQDEGSQLMGLALGLGVEDLLRTDGGEDHHWLDLCAGPGGKTALLAGLSVSADADLLATELQPHRTELVEKAVAMLVEAGAEVECRTADGTAIGTELPDRFSRVLADVPCTGMGALRRRPEARWRRTPADVGQLARLQRELLTSAIAATAPGGVLAYVTCSPHLAETLLVVGDVMRRHPELEQLDARPAVRAGLLPAAQDTDLGAGPTVQLWPHVHGTDAMFLALLRKRPSGDAATDPSETSERTPA
jgi:16S rRNA (cytosine967-C5)-methyltransferase